jgi:hypothetical protein
MPEKLHYQAVSSNLKSVLKWVMNEKIFNPFLLVGGTALSLQLGHRESADIDLFSDAEYGSIDFYEIDNQLRNNFAYIDSPELPVALGKSYFVGDTEVNCIKLDLFYTDTFIRPAFVAENIRFASLEDIVAMKIDVIGRGGRKKDFWDIHELLNKYSINEMLILHKERYSYSHNLNEILTRFTDFENADNDFDPVCLMGKYWELIKLDIFEAVKEFNR